ncbi:MAG: RHS repeat domain-containing protein [Bacteroidota bacterium]
MDDFSERASLSRWTYENKFILRSMTSFSSLEHLNSNNSPFKFNAKELDCLSREAVRFGKETGNYYYGARYYDPKFSIWLSVDPMAEQMPEWSSYAYTFQNPIRYTDPTGMKGEDWVYDKKNDKYIWKKEVTSSSDVADDDNLEYVGMSNTDINEHYDNNNNFFERLVDFFIPNIDGDSFNDYVNDEINERIEKALASYDNGQIENIDMNIRGLKENSLVGTNKNHHRFTLDITFENKRVKGFKGYFLRRNNSKNNQLSSLSIYAQKGFDGKTASSRYSLPIKFLFFSPGHRNEAIIDINISEEAESLINNYLTKKYYENKK